jgi:DNA-binding MarR family transcriptional regulator
MMKSKSLKTLQLLEAIAEEKPTSQRDLSDSLQMSLGLVNSFIKRLVRKGYCKVTTIPKKRAKYLLTPAGAMEKTRLTYEYIACSYQYFKMATNKVQTLYAELQKQGAIRVVFYGADELADIALLAMSGTNIQLVDVVDPSRVGKKFYDFVVKETSVLRKSNYDTILVTTLDSHEAVLDEIGSVGVSANIIRFF